MKLTREYEGFLFNRFQEKAPLIQVLIGPRQVGKTTAAQSIYEQWYGHVFESIIGAHLSWKEEGGLYYWKSGNFEVDYVIKRPNETIAIEIKSGQHKNGQGLKEFSREYPFARCELWDKEECLKFFGERMH